jgi:hypothetical protein
MPRAREIVGVLYNFLGTFTSRYSDLDGYWLFGKLVSSTNEFTIDLMSSGASSAESAAMASARELARRKFREQMEKAGIPVSTLREGHLRVTKSPGSRMGLVNGQVSAGHELKFVATVFLNSGKHYANERPVFVAPHNPAIEQRSNRGS